MMPAVKKTALLCLACAALALSGCAQDAPETVAGDAPAAPSSEAMRPRPARPARPAAATATPSAPAETYFPGMPLGVAMGLDEALGAVPDKVRDDASYRSCAAAAVVFCAGNAVTRGANASGDPDACDAAPLPATREACRLQVAAQAAVAAADLAPCRKAGSGAQAACESQAARQLATQKSDPSWCGKLPAPAAASGSAGPVRDERDECLFSLAVSLPTAAAKAACAQVTDANLARTCQDLLKSRAAAETQITKDVQAAQARAKANQTAGAKKTTR